MRVILLTTLVTLFLANGLLAQEQPDQAWLRDVEAGLKRVRYAGRPAVLVFSVHWCGLCEQLEDFFASPKVRPVSQKAVLVLVDADRQPELLRKYKVDGHHKALVLDWKGNELARLDWTGRPDKMLDAFRLAVALNEVKAAEMLFKVGRHRKAVERAEGVPELVATGKPVESARKLIDDVRKLAEEELAEAEGFLKKGHLGQCELACERIDRTFPPRMVTAKVKKLRLGIKRARQGRPLPEGLPTPPELRAPRRAQDLVDRAMVAEWDQDYLEAVELYEEAVRRFPKEAASDEARARLTALKADKKVLARIEQQTVARECDRLMQLGRAYDASGHPEHARNCYRRIIDTHPDTEWAKAAAVELQNLPKD